MTLPEWLFSVSIFFGVMVPVLARLSIVKNLSEFLDSLLGTLCIASLAYISFFVVWMWV